MAVVASKLDVMSKPCGLINPSALDQRSGYREETGGAGMEVIIICSIKGPNRGRCRAQICAGGATRGARISPRERGLVRFGPQDKQCQKFPLLRPVPSEADLQKG